MNLSSRFLRNKSIECTLRPSVANAILLPTDYGVDVHAKLQIYWMYCHHSRTRHLTDGGHIFVRTLGRRGSIITHRIVAALVQDILGRNRHFQSYRFVLAANKVAVVRHRLRFTPKDYGSSATRAPNIVLNDVKSGFTLDVFAPLGDGCESDRTWAASIVVGGGMHLLGKSTVLQSFM